MYYDLKPVRESYNMSTEEFASLIERSEKCYLIYETEKEIPSKDIYMLWKRLPDFPLPVDFFHYTSFSLNVNMRYHRLKQKEIAEMFGIRQSTVSFYFMGDSIPMYELKDKFLSSFKPLIIPCTCQVTAKGTPKISELKELDCRGNFVNMNKKREYKAIREKQGLTTVEHKKLREKERYAKLKAVSVANI